MDLSQDRKKEVMEPNYFVNIRGNQQLVDSDNYVYYCKSKKETGQSYWVCTKTSCTGRANVDKDKKVRVVSSHNHGSDIAGFEAHQLALKAIQTAKQNPNIKPRQILGHLASQSTSIATVLSKRPEASLTR